jgi:PAS domain S-box-containing protein
MRAIMDKARDVDTSSAATPPEAAESALAESRPSEEHLVLASQRERALTDQLRRQLAFSSAIMGNLAEGVLALDRECRITFANPAAEHLLGWREGDLLGRDMHTTVPAPGARAGGRSAEDAPLREVIRSGLSHRDDNAAFAHSDGTSLPVAYSAAPIVSDGQVVGVVIAFRDIAERKRGEARQQRVNEELEARVRERTATLRAANERLLVELAARHRSEVALRERETRLRLMLEQTPAIIWTTAGDLRFTFAAGANLAAIGLGPGAVVGRSLAEIVAQSEADSMTLPAHRRALAGEPAAYTTVRNGRTFQTYVEPLRDPDGAITGTIAIAQDITELSLRRLHDEFIATVSHQLLTPLAAARAGLGLLEIGVANRLRDEDQRLLGNIGRNIGRLEIHLNDLITLNQLKTGTVPFAPDDLDLRAVVTDAMSVIQPLLREKGQELAVVLPEPLPVAGDAEGLTQAVINLLANAHRHTPSGTRVTITGRVAGDEIHLTVSDTGPGIPAGSREAVFQRFHRLAVPAGAATTGSGLGLAIVRGIVELHGGRTWVAGAPGQGAAFHLALPRHEPREEGGAVL